MLQIFARAQGFLQPVRFAILSEKWYNIFNDFENIHGYYPLHDCEK